MYEGIENIYDLIHIDKNYLSECLLISNIIKNNIRKKNIKLLDVGCGTGNHLCNFKNFDCYGIDNNKKFVKIANDKGLNVSFGDMIDFNLNQKFDVIVCLFGVISHVFNNENFNKVLNNFKAHLQENGIVLIEPWLFKHQFFPRTANREISKNVFVCSENTLEENIAKLKKKYSVYGKEYSTCIENYCFEEKTFIDAIEACGFSLEKIKQKLEVDYPNGLFLLRNND